MASEPTVEARAEQPYVAIPIKATLRQWDSVNALVNEVYTYLEQKGITPAGPLFYRYWVIGDLDHEFDLEVGVPVPTPLPRDGHLVPGSIPAGSYATLTHHGHPDRLLQSLTALKSWAATERLELANRREDGVEIWGGRFELYLTNPAEEPDLNKWSIGIAYLLRHHADEPS